MLPKMDVGPSTISISRPVHGTASLRTGTLIIPWEFALAMIELVPPSERICERCGRRDVWDDEQTSWSIATEDGEKLIGEPYCLHEWDINGNYNPVAE